MMKMAEKRYSKDNRDIRMFKLKYDTVLNCQKSKDDSLQPPGAPEVVRVDRSSNQLLQTRVNQPPMMRNMMMQNTCHAQPNTQNINQNSRNYSSTNLFGNSNHSTGQLFNQTNVMSNIAPPPPPPPQSLNLVASSSRGGGGLFGGGGVVRVDREINYDGNEDFDNGYNNHESFQRNQIYETQSQQNTRQQDIRSYQQLGVTQMMYDDYGMEIEDDLHRDEYAKIERKEEFVNAGTTNEYIEKNYYEVNKNPQFKPNKFYIDFVEYLINKNNKNSNF